MRFRKVNRCRRYAVFRPVHCPRDNTQMIDVAAGPITAHVVDDHSVWYWPYFLLIAITVRANVSPLEPHTAIAVAVRLYSRHMAWPNYRRVAVGYFITNDPWLRAWRSLLHGVLHQGFGHSQGALRQCDVRAL